MDQLATRPSWMPQPVLDLANRLGARTDGAVVRLTQHGTMGSGPGARRMKFSAEQTIQLRQPGFEWRALTGPAGCITVIDALQRGSTTSEVQFLARLRLSGAKRNDAAALLKGQLLCYPAELAWAPDAILQNALLQWSAHGDCCASPCSTAMSGAPWGSRSMRKAGSAPCLHRIDRAGKMAALSSGHGEVAFRTTGSIRGAGCRSRARSAGFWTKVWSMCGKGR